MGKKADKLATRYNELVDDFNVITNALEHAESLMTKAMRTKFESTVDPEALRVLAKWNSDVETGE